MISTNGTRKVTVGSARTARRSGYVNGAITDAHRTVTNARSAPVAKPRRS
jgi:hypothetical protein